jgi:hypothetical protein
MHSVPVDCRALALAASARAVLNRIFSGEPPFRWRGLGRVTTLDPRPGGTPSRRLLVANLVSIDSTARGGFGRPRSPLDRHQKRWSVRSRFPRGTFVLHGPQLRQIRAAADASANRGGWNRSGEAAAAGPGRIAASRLRPWRVHLVVGSRAVERICRGAGWPNPLRVGRADAGTGRGGALTGSGPFRLVPFRRARHLRLRPRLSHRAGRPMPGDALVVRSRPDARRFSRRT